MTEKTRIEHHATICSAIEADPALAAAGTGRVIARRSCGGSRGRRPIM